MQIQGGFQAKEEPSNFAITVTTVILEEMATKVQSLFLLGFSFVSFRRFLGIPAVKNNFLAASMGGENWSSFEVDSSEVDSTLSTDVLCLVAMWFSWDMELVWVQGNRVLLKGTNTLVEEPRQKVKYIPTSVCSSDLMSTSVSTRQGTSWTVPHQGVSLARQNDLACRGQ